jgi:hypothetical protein
MQTKTKLYATSTRTDNSPVYNLLPAHSICNENSRLTDTEKELYKALSKVSTKTLWGAAIQDCLQRFDSTGNRELFTELSMSLASQLKDSNEIMLKIIGEDGVSALRKVSSHNDWLKQANGSLVLSNQIHSS